MIALALALAGALAGTQVFDYDSAAPLDLKEEAAERHEAEVTVHDLTYASPGGRVPAYLVVPDGAGPFAGLLVQHGIPGDRKTYLQSGIGLARTGAVVLLIDAPYNRGSKEGRQAGPFTFTLKDRDEQIQYVVDLRRGIDLLLSRPDVDPNRLGYLGRDHGATMGAALAGVDKRIKAYVLAVPDGGLVTIATGKSERGMPFRKLSEERRAAWLAAMRPIDPVRLVAASAPAALLFQGGRYDRVVSDRDLLRLYRAASEPKWKQWYNTGHALDTRAIHAHVDWLSAQLGLNGPRFWTKRPLD